MRGPAVLLGAESERLAEHVCVLVGVARKPGWSRPDDIARLIERLGQAGYQLQANVDLAAVAERRDARQAAVEGIARYLGKPSAPLLPASA